MENNSNSISFSEIIKGVAIAVVLIVLLAAGYIVGIVVSPNNDYSKVQETTQNFTVQNPENIKEVKINPLTPDMTTTAAITTTEKQEQMTEKETSKNESASNKKETTTEKKQAKEKTVDEIVELFNTSANKIKNEATKVVKNYEYRTVNEDKLVVPSSLESIAQDMMTRFMNDDLEPIEYTTSQEIKENYMVPSQSYVSNLSASDVEKATFKDNGKEYEITIKAKQQKNPTAGVGLGAAFDVIEAHEVAEKTSLIEKFDTTYYDCTVKCKIDKETGRMTWANYTTPLVLDCSVKVFKSIDASVGLTFEKDYNIYY